MNSEYTFVLEGIQSKELYFVQSSQSIDIIPTDIEHLCICRLMDCEHKELIFSGNLFHQLKSIIIGNDCFNHVREFVIDGLESVNIGKKCFRIDRKERDDGICRITNCPNLRHLEIGNRSFEDFKSFEISNVNSLQSIEFGECCFKYADCSLKGE